MKVSALEKGIAGDARWAYVRYEGDPGYEARVLKVRQERRGRSQGRAMYVPTHTDGVLIEYWDGGLWRREVVISRKLVMRWGEWCRLRDAEKRAAEGRGEEQERMRVRAVGAAEALGGTPERWRGTSWRVVLSVEEAETMMAMVRR